MSVSFSSWSATAPFFVQSQYTTFVEETATKGSVIFTAKAVNRAGLPIAGLIYSLKDNDGVSSLYPVISGGTHTISAAVASDASSPAALPIASRPYG